MNLNFNFLEFLKECDEHLNESSKSKSGFEIKEKPRDIKELKSVLETIYTSDVDNDENRLVVTFKNKEYTVFDYYDSGSYKIDWKTGNIRFASLNIEHKVYNLVYNIVSGKFDVTLWNWRNIGI